MGELLPRNELVKQGMIGFGALVGGTVLLLLPGLPGILGWILGGVLAVLGLGLISTKENRLTGALIAAVGILTIVSQTGTLGPVAGWLMRFGGISLLLTGGISLTRFFINLGKRR